MATWAKIKICANFPLEDIRHRLDCCSHRNYIRVDNFPQFKAIERHFLTARFHILWQILQFLLYYTLFPYAVELFFFNISVAND